jgi:hypothetical protein
VKFWKWFFLLVGPLLVGLFIGLMVSVTYPSSMKVASFLCPEDKPDTFIVHYSVTTSDGTGTSFTLYCMSERGEIREIGTWRPMMVVCGITVAVTYALVLALFLWGLVKRLGRPRSPTPDEVLAGVQPPPEGFG